MSNKSSGTDFERKVKRHLEKLGYCAVRSAGSSGPADVVALKFGCMPLFVQCKKNGRLDAGEWNELLDFSLKAGAMPVLADGRDSRQTAYYRLTGRKSGIRGAKAPMSRLEF